MQARVNKLAALLAAPSTISQQVDDPVKVTRKRGKIYKRQVDGLIGALRTTARNGEASAPARGVLGSDVLSTAKILVAMGHCHRRYHVSDGPVVRPSLDYILQNRQADGGFGDADTTRWVVDAMKILNPDGYAEDILACERMSCGACAPTSSRSTWPTTPPSWPTDGSVRLTPSIAPRRPT